PPVGTFHFAHNISPRDSLPRLVALDGELGKDDSSYSAPSPAPGGHENHPEGEISKDGRDLRRARRITVLDFRDHVAFRRCATYEQRAFFCDGITQQRHNVFIHWVTLQ